jgi:predicted anti-sigma-YlaC factor YlaD
MNCDTVQLTLLETSAGASCSAEVNAHLEACADCRRFAGSLQAVDEAFQALRFTSAPPRLATAVLRRARLDRGMERRLLMLALDTISAAGTLAAGAAVLFWIYPHPAVIAPALLLGWLGVVLFRKPLSAM